MKKKIRIIWTVSVSALLILGAVIISTSSLRSNEAQSAEIALNDTSDNESSIEQSDAQAQMQASAAQSLWQAPEPAEPSPSPEPAAYVLANVSPATMQATREYSEEEIYKYIEDGNYRYNSQGFFQYTEEEIYQYSFDEKEYIARVVFAEARGEIFEGQVAVAAVVINRFESGTFGTSVRKVVMARSQFAVSERYNDLVMEAVETAIESRGQYPDNMFYFQASKSRTWRNFVYYERVGGHSFYCAAN